MCKTKEISSINLNEIEKIKNYLNLKINWDSYGASQISEKSIDKAVSFIIEIDKHGIDAYMVCPGPNEEVVVHLKSNEKEIEFVFYPDISKYITFNDNEYVNQGIYVDTFLDELINWLNSF